MAEHQRLTPDISGKVRHWQLLPLLLQVLAKRLCRALQPDDTPRMAYAVHLKNNR